MRQVLQTSARGKPLHSNLRMPRGALWFAHHILVECPRCAKCAAIARSKDGVFLTCPSCGHSRSQEFRYIGVGKPLLEGLDPDFELPLWLRHSVAGHVLWAYNWRHLEDLEFFLTGDWRMHRGLAGDREKVYSYHPRYPKWMFLVKHRREMLKAIEHIKRRRL